MEIVAGRNCGSTSPARTITSRCGVGSPSLGFGVPTCGVGCTRGGGAGCGIDGCWLLSSHPLAPASAATEMIATTAMRMRRRVLRVFVVAFIGPLSSRRSAIEPLGDQALLEPLGPLQGVLHTPLVPHLPDLGRAHRDRVVVLDVDHQAGGGDPDRPAIPLAVLDLLPTHPAADPHTAPDPDGDGRSDRDPEPFRQFNQPHAGSFRLDSTIAAPPVVCSIAKA